VWAGLRHCVSEGTLSEPDLAHVCKCALGRQQREAKGRNRAKMRFILHLRDLRGEEPLGAFLEERRAHKVEDTCYLR
jgi:hypothetical protein